MSQTIPDQPLFATDSADLVINEDLRARLEGRRLKRLAVSKIPVVDKPRDGWPVDLMDLLRDNGTRN